MRHDHFILWVGAFLLYLSLTSSSYNEFLTYSNIALPQPCFQSDSPESSSQFMSSLKQYILGPTQVYGDGRKKRALPQKFYFDDVHFIKSLTSLITSVYFYFFLYSIKFHFSFFMHSKVFLILFPIVVNSIIYLYFVKSCIKKMAFIKKQWIGQLIWSTWYVLTLECLSLNYPLWMTKHSLKTMILLYIVGIVGVYLIKKYIAQWFPFLLTFMAEKDSMFI